MKDTKDKLENILSLASDYISETKNKKWVEGEDWVSYSGPYFDDQEYLAALRVLLDGWMIFGKNARQFEIEFPKHLGMIHGSLTNSGSSALLLAMSALKSRNLYNLPEGTKFITPVVCWPTTLSSMIQNGFEPVFVDVTLPDLNLDLDQMEQKLKEDPEIRGVAFAHVLGNPPNMDRLMKLVEEYDLIFVEDACDALGSYYDGKKLGSFGHISTCSFFPAHHMTMGEGGFVATNNGKIRKVVASMRDWGRACYCNTGKPGCVLQSTACGNRFGNWLPGMPDTIYDHRYVFDEVGYNLKPLDLQAAMGLRQLEKLPELDAARRHNFKELISIFKPYEQYFHLPEATEKSDPCWFAFLLTVKEGAPFTRNDIVLHLEKSKIQTRSYFAGNILMHPGYNHMAKKYGNLNETFPIANLATTSSFFVGTYAGITEEKMNYIKKVVDSFFKTIVEKN
jgi:CDP-6-deoxy-D-xylo-4-hexulose-3-dehydrase